MKEDLLIKYVAGECSPEEKSMILQWAAEDAEHQKRLDGLVFVWDSTKNIMQHTSIDAQASLSRLKDKAELHQKTGRSILWLKIAAILICICAAGGTLWHQFYPGHTESMQAITTENVAETRLADGSVVTLNKNSLLDYPEKFKGNKRVVKLARGEAFFKVSPDKNKPFLIDANLLIIRVVGTSFNVKLIDKNTEVIVETGKVEVSAAGKSWRLLPGQRLLLGAEGQLLKEGNTDLLYQYYRSREFVAKNTPLWRMTEVLNEVYKVNIVIPDQNLRNLPLNTTFKNESLDDILNVIAQTFQLRVDKKGTEIRLIK
ncbi:hypothetical protein DBR11_09660 [Pedobacter sp. HMWF019]|uniref:FecR domain-containing protein n=1 Tax=Pedobacter sp. HMWF019 TaxID=2056856 RepID=UPI000D3DC820|nr:FecR domain-containing protein [Pedobacter sp. HMWF019]PTT00542.1 hypothetical protein DBR11_09660 [Pedobacter sp. HMWF019]